MIATVTILLSMALLEGAPAPAIDVAAERTRVVTAADQYVKEAPVTVTASRSPRSAGGPHDFFSEGDYWWPDPDHPDGPYIQRDGMTNPANFVEHRRALMHETFSSGSRCSGSTEGMLRRHKVL